MYENFVSLAVGLRAAPAGRVLVLNGDVILAPGVLKAVVENPPRSSWACAWAGSMTRDSRWRSIAAGWRKLGKGLPGTRRRVSSSGFGAVAGGARPVSRARGRRAGGGRDRDLYYEDVYSGLCDELTVVPVSIDPGDWAEVDIGGGSCRCQAGGRAAGWLAQRGKVGAVTQGRRDRRP